MAAYRTRPDQSGAVLVMALVFMVAVAVLAVPLAGLASTNLGNTYSLSTVRDINVAADSATDNAIEIIRFSVDQGYSPSGPCSLQNSHPTAVPGNTFDLLEGTFTSPPGIAIVVTCTTEPVPPTSTAHRDVKFTASYNGAPVVNAEAQFWDFDSTGVPSIGIASSLISWSVVPASS